MKIDIIDNFLTSYQADSYVPIFDGMKLGTGLFPWYFTNNLNDQEYLGNYYFNTIIIQEYDIIFPYWLPIFKPLVDRIGISFDNVWRLKVNLYPRTQFRDHHHSHIDYPADSGFRTCLYYVNTNNRVTIFDGKRKVKSKKNRAIFFDGSTLHHSTTPTNCNWGCSINIDYWHDVERGK